MNTDGPSPEFLAPGLAKQKFLPLHRYTFSIPVRGEPQPHVLEQAQEAVRQALQHVLVDTDSDDFDADSTEDDGPTEPSAPEQPSFCAIGWACASGEGRVQAAVSPQRDGAIERQQCLYSFIDYKKTVEEQSRLSEVSFTCILSLFEYSPAVKTPP